MANLDFDVFAASRGMPAPLSGTVQPFKIAVIGDSYVADTGSTDPKSFGYAMAAALRAKYGDAGAGYVPVISTSGSVLISMSFDNNIPQYGRWTDPRRTMAAAGIASTMTGGIGATDTNQMTFSPGANNSYGRGVVDTLSVARVFYTLRSSSPRPGLIIRPSNLGGSDYRARVISSGADFTGTISGSTLTASAVTGLIPRGGALVSGSGVTANSVLATISTDTNTTAGGAGNYKLSQVSTVASGVAMTASSPEILALDTIQTAVYNSVTGYNNNIAIGNMNGDIIVHGVEYYNGQKGVTVTQLGYGGISAYQVAGLDDATQRRFWQLAEFDLVIICLGQNGKTYFGPEAFANHMSTIISQVKSCPRTKVILMRQLDASDSLTSYHPQYDAVYQQLALAYGCGYYDERTASPSLVNYATANAAGLMLDGGHGNFQANTIIGNDLASKIFLPIVTG
ncbi:SGNH/GDSL hydrolase family protein [Sphingomonas sp.]|uniref:SGNH/GDSL hydrolase family protein n=1 Tax=Sphingomonas sp. TaxID=28214 RepID=UPI003B3AC10D